MAKHSHPGLRSASLRLRSTPVRAVLSLGVVFGFGAVGTLAYWTDDATLTGGTFEAGNLDIKLSGADDDPASFLADFALSNMQPGHSKAAIVSVENDGTADFTYTATGTAPGDLASSLVFRVVPGGTISGTGAHETCIDGTETFDGELGGTASAVIAGDRPLASGAEEDVCVQATMPTGTTTGQGESTTSAFQFDAKQVGAP